MARSSRRRAALALALFVVVGVGALVGARSLTSENTPTVMPSSEPPVTRQAAFDWRFESSVLATADANGVGREVRAALPLADGGWLLSVGDRSLRCLVFDSWSCGVLRHPSSISLVRLDAKGTIVAERVGAPDIFRGEVFSSSHLAVIQYGGLQAIDLDTLATVATLASPNVAMTRAADRLYTWESYRREPGATDLVERDPATFAEIARYPHITLDGLSGGAVVLRDYNAFAYTTALGPDHFGVRVLPLDPARPSDVPWLADACGMERVADGRVAVSRGAACSNEDDRLLELRDARDGRVLASAQGGYVGYWGASVLVVDGRRLIDPVTGETMPDVPGNAISVAGRRAISRLGDAGVALLRLDGAPAPDRTTPVVIAQATCTWPDFAHLALATSDNVRCPDLQAAAGAHRVVLSLGRQPTATALTVTSLEVDRTRRVITVRYTQTTTSHYAGPTAQVALVALPPVVTGEWLVWLVSEGDTADSGYGRGPAFAISVP